MAKLFVQTILIIIHKNYKTFFPTLVLIQHNFRCAQKIVTQLEMPFAGKSTGKHKYKKLPQEDEDFTEQCLDEIEGPGNKVSDDWRRWWRDDRKTEEKIDNKKNEIMEKNMELKEKGPGLFRGITNKGKKGIK